MPFGKQVLPSMRYKDYTWKYNPSRCVYSCDKSLVKHIYPELHAAEIEDMDIEGAIISGVGEFFGPTAYQDWQELLAVFKDVGIGEFYHPIFTDVTMASMKKLDATTEPRENYVSYSFEFWQHIPAVRPIRPPQAETTGSEASKQLGVLKRGNTGEWVRKLQEKLIADGQKLPKYGIDGLFGPETESAVRAYQSKHKLKVDGIAGPQTLEHMKLDYYGGAGWNNRLTGSVSSDEIYIIKSGDTLSHIGQRYGIPWRQLAKTNNLSNPHLIHVGQRIIIG